MKKSIFKSKTIWVNLLMATLIILNEHGNQFNISAENQALAVMGINFILRMITKKAVTL